MAVAQLWIVRHLMMTALPTNWWRVSKRALVLGLSTGFLTAAVAVGGELLGCFNCINAWLIETVAFTLLLAVVARPYRTVAVVPAVIVAYIGIISYVVLQGIHTGRWQPDDNLPVVVSFFLLVILPSLFAVAVDSVLFFIRHARQDA